jgi:hypothetical protein
LQFASFCAVVLFSCKEAVDARGPTPEAVEVVEVSLGGWWRLMTMPETPTPQKTASEKENVKTQ